VRRVRREIEAAREKLRGTLGHEPSLADLAGLLGSDEKRLSRTILRINTIESTSPFSSAEPVDETQLPPALVPAEPERPDTQYEQAEVRERVRRAIATLPSREQRVIALYYYGDVTMKEIGAELGVNESRVSQLHARALRRLREAIGRETTPAVAVKVLRTAILTFARKPAMAKASLPLSDSRVASAERRALPAVVVAYDSASRAARSRSPRRNGFDSQRDPVSSRNRSASVPATSPVTKMMRRARPGVAAAIAR
jgi:RNA polymerase sigma factor for flagellar operon FliA